MNVYLVYCLADSVVHACEQLRNIVVPVSYEYFLLNINLTRVSNVSRHHLRIFVKSYQPYWLSWVGLASVEWELVLPAMHTTNAELNTAVDVGAN